MPTAHAAPPAHPQPVKGPEPVLAHAPAARHRPPLLLSLFPFLAGLLAAIASPTTIPWRRPFMVSLSKPFAVHPPAVVMSLIPFQLSRIPFQLSHIPFVLSHIPFVLSLSKHVRAAPRPCLADAAPRPTAVPSAARPPRTRSAAAIPSSAPDTPQDPPNRPSARPKSFLEKTLIRAHDPSAAHPRNAASPWTNRPPNDATTPQHHQRQHLPRRAQSANPRDHHPMSLTLGIDTGGTHTDAVALDPASGRVVAWHKTPTTHADLAVGISAAINGLQSVAPSQVSRVALSTTLATNAAIEGLGGRVCALLIGYDQDMLRRYGLTHRIHAAALEFIPGRHDVFGEERAPLDEDALRRAVERWHGQVDAFAISSYLSVRNPEHEIRAAEIVSQLTDRPVVTGGSVGRSLDSIRRATTAVLNARLIPHVERLLTAIDRSVSQRGITAPITVVRGDGAVMPLAFAKSRPVETLLSGPAASAVGAHRLTGRDAALVVDMGGTTTDVALLRDGRPKISDRGASISDWRTAVRAADVRSFGTGGDSRILADPLDLSVGPQRVQPLAAAAAADPSVAEALARLDNENVTHRLVPVWEFLTVNGAGDNAVHTPDEQAVCDALREGPLDVTSLARRVGLADARLLNLRALIARGLVRRIGLTPTDVLHARGEFQGFDVDSAVRACRVAARECRVDLGTFLARTHELVVRQLGEGVLRRAVAEFDQRAAEDDDRLGRFVLDRSLSRQHRQDPLDVRLEITDPIVALGAPARAWLPKVAARLHAECHIPELAGVASAVGAAASQVVEQVEFLLRPLYARSGITGYVVHGPAERRRFASIAAARAYVEQAGPDLAHARARAAGVAVPRVTRSEHSWDAAGEEPGEGAYLMETQFTFTGAEQPDGQARPLL